MVLYIYKKWNKETSKKIFNIDKFFYIYLNKKICITEQIFNNFEYLVLCYLKDKKKFKKISNENGFKILHNSKDLLDYSNEKLKISLLKKEDFLKEEYEEFKIKSDLCKIQKINFNIDNSNNFIEYLKRDNYLGSKYYSVKFLRLYSLKNKTITKISFYKKKGSNYSLLFNDIKYYPYFEKIKDKLIKLDFLEDQKLTKIKTIEKINSLKNKINSIKNHYTDRHLK